MTASITLPGRAEPLEIAPPGWAAGYPPPVSRRVYAAAHVASIDGGDLVDWDATYPNKFRKVLLESYF